MLSLYKTTYGCPFHSLPPRPTSWSAWYKGLARVQVYIYIYSGQPRRPTRYLPKSMFVTYTVICFDTLWTSYVSPTLYLVLFIVLSSYRRVSQYNSVEPSSTEHPKCEIARQRHCRDYSNGCLYTPHTQDRQGRGKLPCPNGWVRLPWTPRVELRSPRSKMRQYGDIRIHVCVQGHPNTNIRSIHVYI